MSEPVKSVNEAAAYELIGLTHEFIRNLDEHGNYDGDKSYFEQFLITLDEMISIISDELMNTDNITTPL